MEPTGPKLTNPYLWDVIEPVLMRAYERPFTTRSDFARDNPEGVAMAGQIGWLTTKHPSGHWSNQWRITADGLRLLEAKQPNVL